MLSYLRVAIGKDRLDNLALLSIERDTLEMLNFYDIIDQFATVKE